MRLRPTLILAAGAVPLLAGAILVGGGSVAASDRVIVVVAGDTLGGIAARVGVPVETLAQLNSIDDPDHIVVGQRLRLRAAPGTSHRVAAGETLSSIAAWYGSSVDAIARANEIGDPSYVQAGAVLSIPAARSGSPSATSGAGRRSGSAATSARRSSIRRLIASEARSRGVPVPFALAVAWQESGWQQKVRSSAGAVGVMQLLPATADWVGSAMLGEVVNISSARSNVRAGVALLDFYLARYHGNRSLALAAYYQGMSAADIHGIYPVTRPYIASILALERTFGG